MSNKSTPMSARNNHVISDMIANEIESGNFRSWARPFVPVKDRPLNFNGAPYGPMNNLLLSIAQLKGGYKSRYWITAKKGVALGGRLMDMEEPTPIYTYVRQYVTYDSEGKAKWWDRKPHAQKSQVKFVLRIIHMYNLEQFKFIQTPEKFLEEEPFKNVTIQDDKIVETVVEHSLPYLNYYRIDVVQEEANRAYYDIHRDLINVPNLEQFTSSRAFALTYMHEIVHSTGHHTRLNRFKKDERRTKQDVAYTLEELVAELGANIILHDLGIPYTQEDIESSADYMAGWASTLRKEVKWLGWADSRAKRAKNLIAKKPEVEIEFNTAKAIEKLGGKYKKGH